MSEFNFQTSVPDIFSVEVVRSYFDIFFSGGDYSISPSLRPLLFFLDSPHLEIIQGMIFSFGPEISQGVSHSSPSQGLCKKLVNGILP